jgi:F0F1-type ATP synthase alpha subunit
VDDLPVGECRAFELGLYQFLDTGYSGLLAKIREKKTLDDQLRGELHSALKEYKEKFVAERGARTTT